MRAPVHFALPCLLLVALNACDDGASADAPPDDATARDDAARGDLGGAGGAPADGAVEDALAGDAAPADAALGDAAPDAGPPISRPRFDPGGEGFYATPWPSDARLTAAGTPDLAGFAGSSGSFVRIRDEIQQHIVGFATMPIIYVAFDDPIAEAALPTPPASTAPDSPLQLIELGERCGRRVPVEAAVRVNTDRFVDANTLQVKNTVGTVLEPGVPYGFVVLRSFGADLGRPAVPSAAFAAAWAGDGSRFAETLAPLRACLGAAGVEPEDVAVATVFTPQDPVAELRAMRALVADPAKVETRPPTQVRRDPAWSRRRLRITTYSGLVEMPIFQDGDTPYTQMGGGLVPDADGVPTIQRWEPVPFAVAMRDLDTPPEGPRPAVVFIDGTGWDRWDHLRGRWMGEALDAGFIVFSFMPQFHGGRAGTQGGPELATFNFLNPPAGRTNFRQQAAENAFFVRVIREQLAGLEGLPPIDTDHLVYGGHSQGSLAGALTAAVSTEYVAYVLNGLSAYLTLTILERKDLLDFERVVRSLLGSPTPLDLFSPALHMMQLGGEAVDPHNFARLWRGTPARPAGNHVFVINGYTDDTTTPRGMDHLTISANLPTFDPPGWDIDPLGVGAPPTVALPARGNAVGSDGAPLTLATYLDPEEDHFTIHRSGTLRQMALRFWQTAIGGETPLLQPTVELMCADGGDDDQDGDVDCADADCAAREPCFETHCDDEIDNDGDGAVDCADPDCVERRACQEDDCGDGEDEDGDGLTDCDDPGCSGREPCRETRCRDGEDGDGDGDVDCDDADCSRLRECIEWSCSDDTDNDGDGDTDCADSECLNSLACPEPACDDGTDEDGNGAADCEDLRCVGTEACPAPAELECDDGEDEDADGLTDCADPDCALAEACRTDTCADGDLGAAMGRAIFQGTLEGRADTYDPGDCTPLGSGEDAPDLALRWTAPADGVFHVSTLGSAEDTVLTVYPDDCDRTRELFCGDDQPGVRAAALDLTMVAGDSVVIVVSAYDAEDAAPVTLHIVPRGE